MIVTSVQSFLFIFRQHFAVILFCAVFIIMNFLTQFSYFATGFPFTELPLDGFKKMWTSLYHTLGVVHKNLPLSKFFLLTTNLKVDILSEML
jgi:hypothetical protein